MLVSTIPRRCESASLSRLSMAEGVMVAFEAGVYVQLNESAMAVWDRVDGQSSVEVISRDYAGQFGLVPEKALQDVTRCLQRFLELQVIRVD